jgi:hypothetical protein
LLRVVGEWVFGSLRVVKVGAGDASWKSYENFWGFFAREERPMVSVVNSGGDFSSRDRSYVDVHSSSTSGLKL